MKILELIEEWRSTICQTSRYKEDLGFIRDMHRLLSNKGYVFPEVRKEDAAVLNPSDVGLSKLLRWPRAYVFSELTISRRDGRRGTSRTVSQATRINKKRKAA
jgi:hypothetical protein